MKKILYFLFFISSLSLTSCSEDYLDTVPTDQIGSDDVFTTTEKAWGAVNGIHRQMYSQWEESQDMGGFGGMMIAMDAMGEDLVFPVNQWYANSVYKWIVHRGNTYLWDKYPWDFMYQVIKNANMIINNIDAAVGPDTDKKMIKAEALTYRAWAHFFLVQLYAKRYDAAGNNSQAGIPLMTINTTDPQPRASVEEVYTQINKDLDDAIALFEGTRARATKSHFDVNVAEGIKARVLLTQGKWSDAAQMAAKARAGYTLMSNKDYQAGFNSASNNEWMWGSIQIADQTTYFYHYFAFMSWNFNASAVRTCPKCINSLLYNNITATDVRKNIWHPVTTSMLMPTPSYKKYAYMNTKFAVADYTSSVGDVPYMRAGEMYLIEAEAYARAGETAKAQDALYTLAVNRDPSYVKSTKTGQSLIDEIMIQRRVELWGEGFRFLDLKRLNLPLDRTGANHVASQASVLNVAAGDKKWEWLIPKAEMDANPKMVQNPL